MTTYLLDSNVFIQAKNLHYGLDFCPAFWHWLDETHAVGTVCSIDSVRTELIAGNDDLSAWVQQRPSSFFIPPSAATVPSLQVVTHAVVANTTRRIKIPNACLGMSVRYVTPFAMLRAEKAGFVLPSPPVLHAA